MILMPRFPGQRREQKSGLRTVWSRSGRSLPSTGIHLPGWRISGGCSGHLVKTLAWPVDRGRLLVALQPACATSMERFDRQDAPTGWLFQQVHPAFLVVAPGAARFSPCAAGISQVSVLRNQLQALVELQPARRIVVEYAATLFSDFCPGESGIRQKRCSFTLHGLDQPRHRRIARPGHVA
jgi:hypothetical protein